MSLKGPILYQAGRKTLLSSILCNQPSRKLASYTHRGGQQYWPKCDDAVRLESRGRPVRVCLILLVDKKCRWQVLLGAVMKRKVLTTTRRKQSPTHALSTDNRLNCVRLAPAITHIADLSLVHCRFPLTFCVMSLLLTLRASSTERLCSGTVFVSPSFPAIDICLQRQSAATSGQRHMLWPEVQGSTQTCLLCFRVALKSVCNISASRPVWRCCWWQQTQHPQQRRHSSVMQLTVASRIRKAAVRRGDM